MTIIFWTLVSFVAIYQASNKANAAAAKTARLISSVREHLIKQDCVTEWQVLGVVYRES